MPLLNQTRRWNVRTLQSILPRNLLQIYYWVLPISTEDFITYSRWQSPIQVVKILIKLILLMLLNKILFVNLQWKAWSYKRNLGDVHIGACLLYLFMTNTKIKYICLIAEYRTFFEKKKLIFFSDTNHILTIIFSEHIKSDYFCLAF
jgi:hypothetical protein